MFRILFMTINVLTISIWVNRKFETSECFFWYGELTREKTTGVL